jgi:hypothetical protein
MKIKFQHPALDYHNPATGEYDEEFENVSIVCQGSYEVCACCKGTGSHFRSDLDEDNLVRSMYDDGDDDGMESYFNGAFDCICKECKGTRVVAVPVLPEWADRVITEWYRDEAEYNHIRDQERRVGA